MFDISKKKAFVCDLDGTLFINFEYNPEENELIALTYDKELTYEKLANATSLWNMRNVPPSPMCPIRTANQKPVDFVCVLSGETTVDDLAKYTGTPPAITVETFDKIDKSKKGIIK